MACAEVAIVNAKAGAINLSLASSNQIEHRLLDFSSVAKNLASDATLLAVCLFRSWAGREGSGNS
jgi:hypothetical protein